MLTSFQNNSPYPPPQAPYAGPPPGAQQFPQQGYGYSASSLPTRPTGAPGAPAGLPQRPDAAGGYYEAPGAAAGDEIDQLIRMAESGIKPAKKPEEDAGAGEKKAKKGARMVYADENFSPEEAMARLPRYAFVPPAL